MKRIDTTDELGNLDGGREEQAGAGFFRLVKDWGVRLFPYFAVLALVSSIGVISLGGIVRVTGSGLGCPDWPLCHGQIIPPPDIKAWIEYIHRLSAATTTIFTLLMGVTAFARFSKKSTAFFWAILPIPLLFIQAILGAYTVLLELPPMIALAHIAVAMIFVGSLAIVVASVKPWTRLFPRWLRDEVANHPRHKLYIGLITTLAVVAFLVIVSGAHVTRSGASLACIGFPVCNTPAANEVLERLQNIHALHRLAAAVLIILMLVSVVATRMLKLSSKRYLLLAHGLAMLLGVQVALGISNVMLRLPQWAMAGHVAVAGLFFATTMLLVGTLWRSRIEGDVARPAPDISTPQNLTRFIPRYPHLSGKRRRK